MFVTDIMINNYDGDGLWNGTVHTHTHTLLLLLNEKITFASHSEQEKHRFIEIKFMSPNISSVPCFQLKTFFFSIVRIHFV